LSLALSILLTAPAIAAPPERTPEQRQTLVDLAYVLGETHALHRVCAGKDDDTWRRRMQHIIAADGADPGFRTRLTDSFNAGFLAPEAQAADCASASVAEGATAKRGAALARRLVQGPAIGAP
jgi:uncharacterized protein (TIGR02301 family)